MAGTVLASVPVNSEAGSYLTFAFPILLFCAIAAALYIVLFGRPHARVPARRIAAVAHAGPPSPEAAHAAAVAGGLPTAEGGGSAESGVEAAGAVSAAIAATEPDGTEPDGTEPGDSPEADGPADGTEASE
ncbi:MAG: hypothetical protein ABSF03_09905 [Streptosporangiaceae bacterium]